jgi:TrmH family RNA methyltransferase
LNSPNYLDFVLIPDQIRDPGNLGTLLRSAAATGVQAVFLPPDTTDAFAPKVVRAGMGAHFRLPIREMTWEEIGQSCKSANQQIGKPANEQMSKLASEQIDKSASEQMSKAGNLQVYVADMKGQSCWEVDLRKPFALIIGSEAEGASDEARKLATQKISIPMVGNVESLNAGVAGSVLMFEAVRQRLTALTESA